ncbi:unnamed protein product [Effrenium voratum]|uniref:Uncharacterized protein n=1 Tax=Effrenium voratum TaxID=2562239 RepID=A0AA36IQH6_9DINO|nr:unnamed protein product [Effrenium voratum]CAJ1416455.1 unnamed protein product [Effrenium voratum]
MADRGSAYRFHLSKNRQHNPAVPSKELQELRWSCASARPSNDSGAVATHWARQTCELAERYVREAFRQVKQLVPSRCSRSVPLVLGVTGPDAEDHQATMKLTEELFREEMPQVSSALISPSDLRSLPFANRKIYEKLSRLEPVQMEPEEGEEEEVAEMPSLSKPSGSVTVLIFQGADAAPKDVLREVLCFWHASCAATGTPLLVLLGLKQLPSSRQSLFDEDDEQLPFVHAGSVTLFNSLKVCEQMTDFLIEDCSCPVALCPDVMKRLREIYIFQQQSASHFLRVLSLLSDEALVGSMGWLHKPLGISSLAQREQDAVHEQLQAEFCRRAQALTRINVQRMAKDRKEANVLPLELAEAAAEAIAWRSVLVASLPLFEVLTIGAWSAAKHCDRLTRLCNFLKVIWPRPEGQEAKQERELSKYISNLQETLHLLPISQLQKLLTEAATVAPRCVSVALEQELQELQRQAAQCDDSARSKKGLDRLRDAFRNWVGQVMAQYWRVLGSPATREMFLSLCCSKESLAAAEKHLASDFEGKLQHLGFLSGPAEPLADAARLFQFLECCSGRQTKVSELWLTFGQMGSSFTPEELTQASKSRGRPSEKEKGLQALKLRFQKALLSLHHLGLFAPAPGGSQKGLSGWRLRKRAFGRAWLRDPPTEERQFPAPRTPPHVEKDPPPTPPPRDREVEGPVEPLEPGNRFLKRLPFPRRVESPYREDEYRVEKKRKSERIFFG